VNTPLVPKIKTGHFFSTHKNQYKDWIIGSFVEDNNFNSKDFELKFQKEKKGLLRKPKKVLNKKDITLAIIVYGKIRMNFGKEDFFMKEEGDYIYWSPDAPHEFEFLENSLVITLRWKKSESFWKKINRQLNKIDPGGCQY
jgi:hypothetical protein